MSIKNLIFYFVLTLIIGSCHSDTESKNKDTTENLPISVEETILTQVEPDSEVNTTNTEDSNIDSIIAQHTFEKYIVIVDTNYNYFLLREKMLELSNNLKMKIDTLNRGYDQKKDMIMEDGADEIYIKGYFPRRFDGINLSLEYYEYFFKLMNFEKRNIALVACITTEKQVADSVLPLVKKYEPNSFVINCELYMGCMH